jgi:hypothetical protein
MKTIHILGWTGAAGGGVVAVAALGAGCQSTPTPLPNRTFERPQKVAAVCLGENASDGGVAVSISPLPLGACQPVPFNVNGAPFENHMIALVTQQTRGQLAAVDLTSGNVVDEDRSTPGINFIPVGANPSDVAVSPDFDPTLTFVSSRDPNSFAIYGIDNVRLLGDAVITADGKAAPLTLPDLRACQLPQPPSALGIVTLPPGGAGPAYAIVAVLQPWAGAPAEIVTVDPRPFAEAAVAGVPQLTPGILQPCTLLGNTTLAGAASVPQAWSTIGAWPDGVVYADAAAASPTPPLGPTCTAGPGDAGTTVPFAASFDAGPFIAPDQPTRPSSIAVRDDAPVAYVADGVLPLIHILDLSGGGAPVETGQFFATSVAHPSTAVPVGEIALSPATSDHRRYLYAIDGNDKSIMVFDATSPVPPPTPQPPLLRPHPELTPLSPVDRLTFSGPVAAIAFATHDWPLVPPNATSPVAYTGLLCNPNPEALADGGATFVDGGLGGFYRADKASLIPQTVTGTSVTNFPSRLRGVFAFVTITNGPMVAIDVDDWDAPCRRPDPMQDEGVAVPGGAGFGQPGVLALPEPLASGPDDLDPYHAPLTTQPPSYLSSGVSEEAFFPVSAPNRVRSSFLLRNDPTTGEHLPFVVAVPQLYDSTGSPFASPNGAPLMLPTALAPGFMDPTYITNPTAADPNTFTTMTPALESATTQDAGALLPSSQSGAGVRVSFDDPTAHIDQDWTVTFEGVLPTANDIVADISTTDGFQSLILQPGPSTQDASASNGARLCSRGIEDWNAGKARIQALAAEGDGGPLSLDPQQASYTADYIEITDDLAVITDPYWLDPTPSCWQNDQAPTLENLPDGTVSVPLANARYNACFAEFGPSSLDDTTYSRDFPILEATDNTLHVGRWAWSPQPTGMTGQTMPASEQTTNRTIVGPDPSNVPFLKFATCCFHSQPHFKVRAGGEWVTTGLSSIGLLHHVGVDPVTGACAVRCSDPSQALLNSRAFEVETSGTVCAGSPPPNVLDDIGRDSPFAMRNPMFSFLMWNGCGRTVQRTPRDAQWRFSLRGGFTPVAVNIAGTTGALVAPQSMLYIPPFGQMAVVDGAQQGLVLIDLNTLAFAHDPYF